MRTSLAFVLGNFMSNLKRKESSSSLLTFLPAKKNTIDNHAGFSTAKEWKCSACTYANAAPTLACEMCQTPLPSFGHQSSDQPPKVPAKASVLALGSSSLKVKKTNEDTTVARNIAAEALAAALEAGSATPGAVKPTYLTCGGDSWYILARGYWPSPNQATFDEQVRIICVSMCFLE